MMRLSFKDIFRDDARPWKAGVLTLLAAFAVYANSLLNGFVWDDTNVILTNELLRGSPLDLFRAIDVTRDYELLPYYRPLAQLSFMIEWIVHGLSPFWMHLFNVLLHGANTFLVYCLIRTLSNNILISLLSALLFAVHPLNTESVDFLSGGRNTMLACFFSLSSLLLYRSSLTKGIRWAVYSGIAFGAGLFSKESAFMTIVFIIWMELRQLRTGGWREWRTSLIRMSPTAVMLFVYLFMRWQTLSGLGIQSGIIPGLGADNMTAIYKVPDLLDRLSANLYIIPRYLQTMLFPVRFSLRYEIPSDISAMMPLLLIFWAGIVGLLLYILRKQRDGMTLFGVIWFTIFYLPVSGLVVFPSAPMADRYMYLPAIGIWVIMAAQVYRLIVNRGRSVVFTTLAVLIVLGSITIFRNADWRNDISLFQRFVKDYPDDPYAHSGLGNAYYAAREIDLGNLDLAEDEFLKAIEIRAVIPGVYTTLGNIRLYKGDNEGALRYYNFAVGIYPLDKEALLNRAITLENLGRGSEALRDFMRFLSVPGSELADARPYAEARIRALTSTAN